VAEWQWSDCLPVFMPACFLLVLLDLLKQASGLKPLTGEAVANAIVFGSWKELAIRMICILVAHPC